MNGEAFARQIEAEREKVVAVGLRASSLLTARVVSTVVSAYTQGRSPVGAVRLLMHRYTPIVAHTMALAHVRGIIRSRIAFADHVGMGKRFAGGDALDGAIDIAKRRAEISSAQFETLAREYGGRATAAVADAGHLVEQRLQKTIGKLIERGATVKTAIPVLRKAMEDSGLDADKPYLVEQTLRTQSAIAFAGGRVQANEDDDAIDEILWGYEYFTVGDDRVRPEHAALDRCTLPKDDSMWKRIMPPNGYNCRCTVVEIFDRGVRKPPPASVEIQGVRVVPGPDEGWDFHPLDVVPTVD